MSNKIKGGIEYVALSFVGLIEPKSVPHSFDLFGEHAQWWTVTVHLQNTYSPKETY